MRTVLGIAVVLTPVAVLLGALYLMNYVARRRQLACAEQIALTDAIHRELGAIAAPCVTRESGGGWRVSMRVPLDRPGTVAALLHVTNAHFATRGEARPVCIVLTSQTVGPALVSSPSQPAGRRAAEPLAAALR